MTHEHASELLAAFALHALDRDGARAVSAHVRSCAECQRELASLQGVTEQLGSAVGALHAASGARAGPGPAVRSIGAIGVHEWLRDCRRALRL